MYSFLAEPDHLARIGTVEAGGMPRVAPLWFILDGDRRCFTPREPVLIWQNMLRDPRIGISIDEDPRGIWHERYYVPGTKLATNHDIV